MDRSATLSLRPRSFRVPLGVPVAVYTGERRRLAIGRDLSPTGIFLCSACRLREGAQVFLEVGLDDECFLVEAEVARVEPGRGCGLRFVDLRRDARLAIVDFVARKRDEMDAAELLGGPPSPAETPAVRNRSHLPAAPGRSRSLPPRRTLALLATLGLAAAAGFAHLERPIALAARPMAPLLPAPAATPPPAAPTPGPRPAAPAPTGTPPALALHLARGHELLAAGQWSLPRGGSALDEFRAAVAIHPHNAEALQGVAAVIEAYLARARDLERAGDRAAARRRLRRALALLESDPVTALLSDRDDRIAALRQALARRRPV